MRNVNRGSIGGIYGEKLVPEPRERMSLFYTAAFPLSCLDIWPLCPFNSLKRSYLNMVLNRPSYGPYGSNITFTRSLCVLFSVTHEWVLVCAGS